MNESFRYKLWMMGVEVTGPIAMLCDSEARDEEFHLP
jgi:hypothetical protein